MLLSLARVGAFLVGSCAAPVPAASPPLLRKRILAAAQANADTSETTLFVNDLLSRPIAESTDEANEQHYELPTEFFQLCLGKNLKYSSCLYDLTKPLNKQTLSEAEDRMLELYLARADLQDGQEILELGCGWGSLSLFMASRLPKSTVTVVSNSATQKAFIDNQAKERGITNLTVKTCDINDFDTDKGKYDRAISIEMFEHMKNYEKLMGRVSSWLKPGGKLFVHIFTHMHTSYHFETTGKDDWMGQYFFTGGTMPSDSLLLYFQHDLRIEKHWRVNGRHYAYTSEHWLQNQDRNKQRIMEIMRKTYGDGAATAWWNRWRVFWMACAELFATNGGNEWMVSHYRFAKPSE